MPKLIAQEGNSGKITHFYRWDKLATFEASLGCRASGYGSFRKLGVPYFGVLIIRILLFRVITLLGSPFSETPI